MLVLDAVEDIEALARMKIPQPGGWFPEATEAKAEIYLEKIAAIPVKGLANLPPNKRKTGRAAGDMADSYG